MAIVKMNKFTLLLLEAQKEIALKALQNYEKVEFINLQDEQLMERNEELQDLMKDSEAGTIYTEYEENLFKLKFILEFLNQYVVEKSGIMSAFQDKKELSYEELNTAIKNINWEDIYSGLKVKEEKIKDTADEKTKLRTEINSLLPWENFDAPFRLARGLKVSVCFIGTISKHYERSILEEFNENITNGFMEIINRDSQDIYFYSIVHNSESDKAYELFRKNGFTNLTAVSDEIPKDTIARNKARLISLQEQEEEIKAEIKVYGQFRENIKIAYEYYNNRILRLKASRNFLKTGKVVAICGWNEKGNNDELRKEISDSVGEDYYLSFSEVSDEEEDEVPVKLSNGAFASSFEGIIEMYSMPRYKEIDPTPILSVFYFVFFGMMLSDAGYGLVMTALSGFALLKVKDKEKKKTFKLFLFAGISTIFWGSIYGGWFGDLPSYFGINPPMLLNPAKDITQIFIMSLIFGFIHVFTGLGIKGYMLVKSGKIKDALYDVLTWYVTLTGAVLMILGLINPAGKILFFTGITGLLLTQGRSAPSIGGKIGWGIYGVYGITGYLGDIISYSRLLALGLATGFIANALNLIINLVPSPAKYVFAPFLFIALHTFNLLINGLGAYVHTARLQYLEFFSKFYEGGGKKFTPYKPSGKYIKITK